LNDIRTDVGVSARSGAGAVVSVARELVARDQPVVLPNSVPTSSGIGTEPCPVPGRAARDTKEVRVSPGGVGLSAGSSGVKLRLSDR